MVRMVKAIRRTPVAQHAATSKGNSSSNPDRVPRAKSNRSGGQLRTKATINRLKMYTQGKVMRNKAGDVIKGELASRDQVGGKDITAATGRVQPDRWRRRR